MTKTMAEGLATFANDQDLRAAKLRLGLALPDDGWLGDYMRAVTPLTDAPAEFHLVAGLCALSSAIGNRLSTREWGQNVFPHLWAILVAPSSFWRKSTAIGQAEQILRSAAAQAMLPSDFSREKLLAILVERPAGLLTLKEFGGFLAMLSRDYMGGTKEMLTELYDGPEHYTRALKKDDLEIRRPALTLLGATTLDWLEAKITDGDLQGGFLARFLFVTAKEKGAPKGLTGDIDAILRNRLVDALHDVFGYEERRVRYAPEARELYDEWMLGWEAEVMATPHRSDLSGFAVRLQTYALKLAMLYRLSATAYDDEPEYELVDAESVTRAIAYCRHLWMSVTGLIDERLAITKEAKELRRIVGIVGSGATRSQTLRLSKLKVRDFDSFLDTLVQTGELWRAKVRASDVGLDRERDHALEWLSPHPVSNGSAPPTSSRTSSHTASPEPELPVPSGSREPVVNSKNGETVGNSREPVDPQSLSETPTSSPSLSSLSLDESKRARAVRDTRAGGENSKPRRTPSSKRSTPKKRDDDDEVRL